MEQLLLFGGVDRRQGDDGHCTGDRCATCPEIGAGMQGCEPTIEPGITHQCWKAIHALQQCWCSAEVGGIFRLALKSRFQQRCVQGACGQLGGTATAGHRFDCCHRRLLAETGHKRPINSLFQGPEQRECLRASTASLHPGRVVPGSNQLQGLALWPPPLQALAVASRLEILGQGQGRPHSPYP